MEVSTSSTKSQCAIIAEEDDMDIDLLAAIAKADCVVRDDV